MRALRFAIEAFDRSGRAFASLAGQVREAGRGFEGLEQRARAFGDRMNRAGRTMSVAVSAPAGLMMADIVRTASTFESSMNKVAAISRATGTDLESLTTMARQMGAETQFSASEAAEAMSFLAMAGFDVKENIAALPSVLNLAASSSMELSDAADIASNVLTGYGKEVEELASVIDVMVLASSMANTNVEQLGGAMKYVGPLANQAGMDFEETTAVLAKMADAGIQGEQSGVALRSALVRLLDPPKAAKKALDDFGVSVTDSTGKMRPFSDIIEDLAPHIGETGKMMRLFGTEAGPAMLTVMEAGAPAIRQFAEDMRGAGGSAERIAKIRMEGFAGGVKALGSAWEEVKLQIADAGLLEAVTNLTEKIRDGVKWFGSLSPEVKEFSVVALAVGVVLGPVVLALGLLFTAIGIIGAPLIAAAAAVAAVSAALVYFWDDLTAAVDLVAGWAEGMATAFGEAFGQISQVIGDAIAGLAEAAAGWISSMVAKLGAVLTGKLSAVWDSVISKIKSVDKAFFALYDAVVGNSYIPDMVDGVADHMGRLDREMVAPAQEAADEVASTFESLADDVAGTMGQAFTAMLSGDKFNWRGAAGTIGGDLVSKGLSALFSGGGSGGGGGGGAGGSIWSTAATAILGAFTGASMFAGGGVFTSPTAFSMGSAGLGVMGEAGPEAIMPLTRGPGGRLGVSVSGGGGGGVAIHIGTIDARGASDPAAVEAAVQRAVAQATAKIAPTVREMRRIGEV